MKRLVCGGVLGRCGLFLWGRLWLVEGVPCWFGLSVERKIK